MGGLCNISTLNSLPEVYGFSLELLLDTFFAVLNPCSLIGLSFIFDGNSVFVFEIGTLLAWLIALLGGLRSVFSMLPVRGVWAATFEPKRTLDGRGARDCDEFGSL